MNNRYVTIDGGRGPTWLVGLVVAWAAPVVAEEPAAAERSAVAQVSGGESAKATPDVSLSLDPGVPQIATLPGGVAPAFHREPTGPQDWRLDFHGFLSVPLRAGVSERTSPGPGQSDTVLHAPPRVPGDFETFEYTAVVPEPWVQLNFSYGSSSVAATVIIAARTVSNASGYFNPPDMLGINDAFLTFRGAPVDFLKLQLNVGAFANNYGNMGEYDMGRYGTPLIARLAGTGATATGVASLGEIDVVAEAGLMGQLKKAPVGVEPAGWNGFADPNVGSSFAAHLHLGVDYQKWVQFSGHFIETVVRDDRANPQAQPDGSLRLLASDLRLSLGRLGHAYLGYSYTRADTARGVSGVVRVLNAPGGKGLMAGYLGADGDGTGTLNTVGGQYDFSLGNFLRYPDYFQGDGPDLIVSLFAIGTRVHSDAAAFNGVTKVKYGGEVGYSFVEYLAVAGRYDRVLPDIDDDTQTHAILSARLIWHSDWSAQDQVVLQYSRWLDGSGTVVTDGYPPVRDPTIVPDEQMLSLMASMWW